MAMALRALWFALAILVGAALAQIGLPRWPKAQPRDGATTTTATCALADGDATRLLQPLMVRNAPNDAVVLERAVHALNIARKHCAYGWTDTALGNYAWIERWVAENR